MYLQNKLLTKSSDITPYEWWMDQKPILSHLKIFGCKTYAYVNKTKRANLDDKEQESIFVGYYSCSKAYRVYIDGKNVTISQNIKFIEDTHLNNPNY